MYLAAEATVAREGFFLLKAFCFGCELGFGLTIRYELKLENDLFMLGCNYRHILLFPVLQHMPLLIYSLRGLYLALQRL